MIRRMAPLALMPAAAFAVHQLRYLLTYGARAGAELRDQGHSYLHSVVPWIVLLLAVSLGMFLRALGRALRGQSCSQRHRLSFVLLWLLCAGGLVAIYTCQELLEGFFATGHPGGLIGVFGHGGWWSIPSALAVALALAVLFRGARWVLREVASARRRAPGPERGRVAAVSAPHASPPAPLAPLVDGWSGRGPPALA